jgi:hypothetical protein
MTRKAIHARRRGDAKKTRTTSLVFPLRDSAPSRETNPSFVPFVGFCSKQFGTEGNKGHEGGTSEDCNVEYFDSHLGDRVRPAIRV